MPPVPERFPSVAGNWCRVNMPLVRVRLMQNESQVAAPAAFFDNSVSVDTVLQRALRGAGLLLASHTIDVYDTKEHKPAQRSQLDAETCSSATVGDIASLGCFWVVSVRSSSETSSASSTTSSGASRDGGSTRSSLSSSSGGSSRFANNSLIQLMQPECGYLPTRSMSTRIEGVIFNQLLDWLASISLGWDKSDSGTSGSGTNLIKQIARALAYLYPFETTGALQRRHVHLPTSLTSSALMVRASRTLALV